MIDYQVLRSRRKTLALQVKHGQVLVRAPYHLEDQFIDSFIQKKEAWLKAKIAEQASNGEYCCNFTQGAQLFLFGRQVTLNIAFAKAGEKATVFLSDLANDKQSLTVVLTKRSQTKLVSKSSLALTVKKQIENYFKTQAQRIILPKVAHYAQLTQLNPKAIKIRQYSARWGSCNNKGELSFNYLLMMLPMKVIDYVIIHELCHLRHLNHSKDFWQLVAIYFPSFKEAKMWVKDNQAALIWRQPDAKE